MSRKETAKQLLVKAALLDVADSNTYKKGTKHSSVSAVTGLLTWTNLHGPITPSSVSVPVATYACRV